MSLTPQSNQGGTPKLMVVGGGTGGHVYPGVAVAEAWLRMLPGSEVVFVGSPKGMEARVIPKLGYQFIPVEARRLKNTALTERLVNAMTMPAAIFKGRAVGKAQSPTVVFGVGGYVSGPVVLAASLWGWPCAIAEQNAHAGLTNRILSRFSQRIYTAFPEVANQLPNDKIRMLGNPVRAAFAPLPLSLSEGGLKLLILGGSQGARSLNQRLPTVMTRLLDRFDDLSICHQTGRGKEAEVHDAYRSHDGHRVEVCPFLEDMPRRIADADLVIARAGATTVAELACIGRPALFIPFPFAADDHQAANARSLVEAGAALMEREEELDESALFQTLCELLTDRARLTEMANKARERGKPLAAESIVRDLQALAGLSEASVEAA